MFSGYIFDVEGTLVDSVPQNLLSLQEALEDAGVDMSYAALQLYSGLDGNLGEQETESNRASTAPARDPRLST